MHFQVRRGGRFRVVPAGVDGEAAPVSMILASGLIRELERNLNAWTKTQRFEWDKGGRAVQDAPGFGRTGRRLHRDCQDLRV